MLMLCAHFLQIKNAPRSLDATLWQNQSSLDLSLVTVTHFTSASLIWDQNASKHTLTCSCLEKIAVDVIYLHRE